MTSSVCRIEDIELASLPAASVSLVDRGMEKFPQGSRHSLLGSSPRDPYASPDSSSQGFTGRRRSGVDFGDVFGGPPGRPASYDGPAGAPFSMGDSGHIGDWDEEAAGAGPRRPWVSLGEKPVFGEKHSPASRRRGLVVGDDFYSDIFRGTSESHCSTPRKMDWDALSSTPGSRVLSPARPLPGRVEASTGSGSPSLTSQHSFRKRMSRGADYPAFGSPLDQSLRKHEWGDLDSVSDMDQRINEAFQGPDDMKTNSRYVSTQFSDLSHKFSNNQDKVRETNTSATVSPRELNNEVSSNPEATNNDGKVFHFSIYSWVGRGVMLVVPSKSNGRRKHEGRLSGLPVPILHGANFPFKEPSSQREEKGFVGKPTREGNFIDHEIKEKDPLRSSNVVKETLYAKLDSKDSDSPFLVQNDSNQRRGSNKPGILNESRQPSTAAEDPASIIRQDSANNSLEKLLSGISGVEEVVWNDEKGHLSNASTATTINHPVDMSKQQSREVVVDRMETENVETVLHDKVPRGRVKGKVKEFVKIFSQDVPRRPLNFVEPRGRSPKVNEKKEAIKISSTKVDVAEKVHVTKEVGKKFGNSNEVCSMLREQPSRKEKLDSATSFDNQTETFTHERHNLESLSSEFSVENIEVSCIHIEESSYEVEECLVEVLDQEDNKLPKPDPLLEEIQNADTKIQQWSKGREGNIRSLLSTLQYVLWPGSGWKPIPLVNIIEGASVRKAYQRALLSLHPDKLQQRGAPAHHKYIAEKVFNILQEAWDHFNSSSSLL